MTWLAMLLVGLGSYAFRAIPLLVLPRLTLSPRVDRMFRNAGAAALTALVVMSVTGRADGTALVPTILAIAVSTGVALTGASMFRIVGAGGLAYVAVSLLWSIAG